MHFIHPIRSNQAGYESSDKKKSVRRAALEGKHKTNCEEAAFQPPQQFGL